ncbi:MAG: ATP-binding cassette domain-containing protein [Tissierellales bacterium]|nr:ATP-binding cassette domain-containing protein [Tissierellales bacterium]
MVDNKKIILEVNNLSKFFPVKRSVIDMITKKPVLNVKAVDNVSFKVYQGENLGLVGESGCGKSTLARTIIRLYEPTAGTITFKNKDFTTLEANELRKSRTDIQMIFQDPYSSLNPRMSVYETLAEAIKYHKICEKDKIPSKVNELMDVVGIPRYAANRFPGEFSGGQRQRIGIARALAVEPEIILADEPVSALDVSIQAQIINLINELSEKLGLTVLFIAHDLGVIRYITDRVIVMYLGKIVEIGNTKDLFTHPKHPYSTILTNAAPELDPRLRSKEILIEGEIPSPINVPTGCRFHPRCPIAFERCKIEEPILTEYENDRMVACHKPY